MVRTYLSFLCVLLCHVTGIANKDISSELTSKLSWYTIVKPQVIHRWSRSINTPKYEEKEGEETVSYVLTLNNTQHRLHLKANRDFFHPSLRQYPGEAAADHNSSIKQHVHCYYHGEVEGYEDSMVALSTCSGLRGVITFGNETYGLQPVPRSPTGDHIFYRLRDVTGSEPVTCGVADEAASTQSHEELDPGRSLASLLRRKRNLPRTSYVELVLVIDNQRYNFKGKNETAVREEILEMANIVDGFYKQLNIRVVLMGLEIFKEKNPFSVEGSAGDVLGNFVKWRKDTLLPRLRHDVGQLIVGRPQAYEGGVMGMAFVGTVCSPTTSGGINVFADNNLLYASVVVAHEMGHNLGMSHDDSNCVCEGNDCIMGAATGGTSSKFSSCSGKYFERLVQGGGGVCLRNQPLASNVISAPECGNGRLDRGEECDCGKPEECDNKCCDAATCKLTLGSVCADGDCCHNCQVKVSGTACRKSVNTCDLPEYCDGASGSCPDDFYIMDGLTCESDAAYCYEGRCQTYDFQCRHLFAPDPATKAADICFKHANTVGNAFGNCGITSKGDFIKCTVDNAMCGKVQCTNVDVNTPPLGATASIQIVEGETCVNADFNVGTDVLDPAYVNPGSPCAKGKTCLNFKCVNASVLLTDLDCDAQTTCNGRGVCNDQGHCHCDDGWAPPWCDKPGRGGSVDSGPAQIDHSLRNGLLIFFLLVVPVLVVVILALLYFFRRDSLEVCLKKQHKSRSPPGGNTNLQSNGNIPPNIQTHSSYSVPAQPQSPSATPAPISGLRYGELDYWNGEQNTGPMAQPPAAPAAAPRQGPGVPRPIPFKQPD